MRPRFPAIPNDRNGSRDFPMTGWGRFEIISKDLNNATVRAFRNVNGLTPPTYGGPVTIGTGWLDSTHFVKFGDLNGDRRHEVVDVRSNGEVWAWPNVNGLDGFPYTQAPVLIGLGWTWHDRVFFAEIMS